MMYQPQKTAYAHQAAALSAWGNKEAFALLHHMRCGKTKVTIDKWGMLNASGYCDDLLVIAPAGVYRTWEKAIKEHADLNLLANLEIFIWESNKQKTKAATARRDAFLKQTKPRVLLMNIEALSVVQSAKDLVLKFINQRRCMAAVDESTTIKSAETKRGLFVQSISKYAYRRVILCGLPTPRSPLDLYGQFAFLDKSILGFDSYRKFESRYADIHRICMMPTSALVQRLKSVEGPNAVKGLTRDAIIERLQGRGMYVPTVPVVRGYQNEDELREKIKPYSHRVLLSDCYDLPPKIYMRREVTLTDEQARIYKDLRTFATAELATMDHVTATHVITRMLRLHQVLCGHTRDEEGNIHTFDERRTAEVLAILEEYEGKAIIWCSYDADVRKVSKAIEAVYGAGSVARFWGGNKDTREAEEKLFLNDPACRFQVATPSAGGKGRTWSNADMMIYYSNINNLEHRAQSEERADAMGKTTPIACVDIVAPGTVDETILEALRGKIDLAAKITGDNYRSWLI